jgi:hypothetical protein
MKKSKSIQELLCQIKDTRRDQGRRHSINNILLTVILGTMSGYHGYRAIEDFCIRYNKELRHALGNPKHGVASYSSIRRVMLALDFNVLAEKFHQWIRCRVEIKKGEWLQIDGKGICGTMTDYDTKYQNFVNLVSLFMNRTGLVLKTQQMYNQHESEINVVREMIKGLDIHGMIISMDALHCQKKLLNRSNLQAMSIWSR